MLRWKTVAVFAVFGLIGPALRLALPSGVDFEVLNVVQSVAILIWPTQMLGIWEESLGPVGIAVLTIGTNVLLFSVLGIVAAAARNQPPILWGIQILAVLLVGWWSIVLRGCCDTWWAFVIAALLCALPFEFARRTRKEHPRT